LLYVSLVQQPAGRGLMLLIYYSFNRLFNPL